MMPRLAGRSAVITGASQGLGLAIARAYVQAGASVMLCARDAAALDRAREDVAAMARPGQRVAAIRADVSVVEDVAVLFSSALEVLGGLQILVNNAGVYGPMGALEDIDWTEWTRAMDININGSVLPMRAVLPHFKRQRYGKIVQLSGGGATNPLPRIPAYAASKAAIVRLAESVALDVKDWGIDVNSIAPGALNTRMMDQLLAAGTEAVGEVFYERMKTLADGGTTPLEVGAALAVYLGSAQSDGITGRLLSAPWDPWEALEQHRSDLDASDIYTLRRIVPKDRGKTWGER
ncbi:MAG: SDR family oxidoreductase [Acidobacteriota bacterium]|nr:SDR family oxidoreductase [Acidobacteriota bacterium]